MRILIFLRPHITKYDVLFEYRRLPLCPTDCAMQRHVFLSYSLKDIDRVRRLRDMLTLCEVPCWPPRILTPGSDYWQAHVEDSVAEAACVVVALSPNTLKSHWVMVALNHAQHYRVPIIPAVVRGEAGHILLVRLAGLEWFDLRRTSRLSSEVAGLARLIQHYMTLQVPVQLAQ